MRAIPVSPRMIAAVLLIVNRGQRSSGGEPEREGVNLNPAERGYRRRYFRWFDIIRRAGCTFIFVIGDFRCRMPVVPSAVNPERRDHAGGHQIVVLSPVGAPSASPVSTVISGAISSCVLVATLPSGIECHDAPVPQNAPCALTDIAADISRSAIMPVMTSADIDARA